MDIKNIRILELIIIFIILLTKQFQILYYFPIMFLSLEYLNKNIEYLSYFNFRILNTIFIGYVLLICLDRGRIFHFTVGVEIIINSIEHLLFGFIICIKISIYYSILSRKINLEKSTLIRIIIVFNILGFVNEFFQNWYKHHAILKLTFDSKKDILMNIIGSILFLLFYQKINKAINNQNTIKNKKFLK